MAPAVGFEPTTNRLTADRSTTELRWIDRRDFAVRGFHFVRISAASKRKSREAPGFATDASTTTLAGDESLVQRVGLE
jgi:hypothetical protein